ncbi:MAG: hypothetical protein HZB85_08890 [Deltaproteobacteria bacterium]|nr:hypothetical protein [Deltaproteobacteria bacterium]
MIEHIVCQKDWIDIFSALLTPVIVVLGGYIALRQWLTSKDKLKFELYDKRYAVFENITGFIASILRSGSVTKGADIQFLRDTKQVVFLFDDKIKKLTDEMYRKAIDLERLIKAQDKATAARSS